LLLLLAVVLWSLFVPFAGIFKRVMIRTRDQRLSFFAEAQRVLAGQHCNSPNIGVPTRKQLPFPMKRTQNHLNRSYLGQVFPFVQSQ